jgi:hypothetical protein
MVLMGEQAGDGKGRVCDGGEVAENNGDGVRMMLSVEARSVKVSVDLRNRSPPFACV